MVLVDGVDGEPNGYDGEKTTALGEVGADVGLQFVGSYRQRVAAEQGGVGPAVCGGRGSSGRSMRSGRVVCSSRTKSMNELPVILISRNPRRPHWFSATTSPSRSRVSNSSAKP